ncbi:hypothetical protein BDB01DRAFT_832503 [Pilobolus umbonatus]|nr:hypothetical protein BDB01DRAFT_832503 [Pilobolus umbonatus]
MSKVYGIILGPMLKSGSLIYLHCFAITFSCQVIRIQLFSVVFIQSSPISFYIEALNRSQIYQCTIYGKVASQYLDNGPNLLLAINEKGGWRQIFNCQKLKWASTILMH